MSDISTIDGLNNKLDNELAWRKKELIDLSQNIKVSNGDTKITLIRCGIPIIYAHWEGFVKNSLSYYLEHVSKQNVPFVELKRNFLGVKLKKEIDDFCGTGKTKNSIHTKTVELVLENMENGTSNIPYKNQIDTKSNLNSALFKDLMNLVGVDYSEFETSFNLIDEQLLNMRNNIAHGRVLKSIALDENTYTAINDRVIRMLENLKEILCEYAEQKKYKI